jgi:hypothetical protein
MMEVVVFVDTSDEITLPKFKPFARAWQMFKKNCQLGQEASHSRPFARVTAVVKNRENYLYNP